MLLYRAEIPGPVKDAKLTPRIAETAKTLWYIYFGLTIACAAAYWLAGMSLFDAIGHSFSTVSLGGFSTHDASIGHFNSATIELICVAFMLISGTNSRCTIWPCIGDTWCHTRKIRNGRYT